MHAFHVPDISADAFVERARQALRELQLDDLVTITLDGRALEVRFSRLGTTVLRYGVIPAELGFEARLEHSKVARLHAAFRHRFEESFDEVIARVGATAVS